MHVSQISSHDSVGGEPVSPRSPVGAAADYESGVGNENEREVVGECEVAKALLSSYLCSLRHAPTLLMFATCWQQPVECPACAKFNKVSGLHHAKVSRNFA